MRWPGNNGTNLHESDRLGDSRSCGSARDKLKSRRARSAALKLRPVTRVAVRFVFPLGSGSTPSWRLTDERTSNLLAGGTFALLSR